MVLLADLPPEILVGIVQQVPLNTLFNLTLTCQWVCKVANPELYASAVRDYKLRSIALFHAVHNGQLRTVRLFLDAGINPNLYWTWKYDTYHYYAPDNAIGIFHSKISGVDDFKRWSRMGRAVYARPGGRGSESEDSYEVEQATAYRKFHRWTPLHIAVRLGHEDIVRLLLDRGADSKLSSNDVCMCRSTSELVTNYGSRLGENFYPLHLAICSGHDSIAKLLTRNGDPLHFTTEKMKGQLALHMAAMYGRLELLKHLVGSQYQGRVNTLDGINQTALDYAYTYRHWDCFEYLVSSGAAVNPVNNDADSLRPSMLVDACYRQNFEDALRLISYGAKTDVDWTDEMGNSWDLLGICLRAPWMEEPSHHPDLQHLRNSYLARNQNIPLPPPKLRNGEFHEAGLRVIKIIVGGGADVNKKSHRELPLVAAARYGLTGVVEHLLSVGADPNGSIDDLDAPLLAACSVENVRLNTPIVPILLRHGAKVNIHNTKGESPLQLVCIGCSKVCNEAQASTTLETLGLLLEGGADPNRTIRGRSPLQLVCNSCSGNAADQHKSAAVLGAIKLLLDYGADPNPRTPMEGGTMNAFEKALSQADLAAATLVLAKMRADSFEKRDFEQMFKAVVRLSDTGCLKLVLSLDKNNVILQDDQSVLRLLKRGQNSTEAVELLLDRGAPLGTCDEGDGNEVYWAVRNLRGVDLVRRLIERGASPDSIRKKKGASTCPLITAMRFKTHETMRDYVKVLLDHGADVDLRVGIHNHGNGSPDISKTPRYVARGICGIAEFVDSILASRKEISK